MSGIDEVIARVFGSIDLNPKGDREASASVNRHAKRIHVKFRDPFLSLVGFLRDNCKEDMLEKKFLASVWRSFGTVTDTFYDEHFSYCFISFSTHEEAKVALENLNNGPYAWKVIAKATVENQIEKAVDCQKDVAGGMKLHRLISDFVDQKEKKNSSLLRASWARPRNSSRYSYNDDDFYHSNDYEYYDDCPDGEDRFVWNEYCVGRD